MLLARDGGLDTARGAMLEEGIAVWELRLHIQPRTKGFLVIDWQSFSLRLCLHRPLLPISLVMLLLVHRSFLTTGFISACGKKAVTVRQEHSAA